MSELYLYPLCIQLAAPRQLDNVDFCDTLALLQQRGFYGVELNLIDFDNPTPQQMTEHLTRYGLRLTMVASGAYANHNKLSLSGEDETVRRKSVAAIRTMLTYAHQAQAGVICGFIKGGPGGDRAIAAAQLERSLSELLACGALDLAPLYLEATNHYEALLVNRVCEGAAFCRKLQDKLHILPDTYHMNIEEPHLLSPLVEYQSPYQNLHLSDNNRYFPGLGALDFAPVLRMLQAIGYTGTITLEGCNFYSLREDIALTADYLVRLAQRIQKTP
ncbi:sugar phosphate isomerase/epimerase family protein [Marasmitruncus massiliensis]|uniref:sugar phosphate isomerase/epimerase family protein n=1 Tax=Marasmitruncus massiliensis TaxID=1944642 RepID=UPI0015E0EC02|nr:sugar phosphate isomerase/epimerase family protein [Marasmitruncus massiliensis]